MIKSISIFILACIFEVGGGYLIWIWMKQNQSIWIGLFGAICIVIYGLIATLQTDSFGRVYAAYGGIFIIFSLLWACFIDGFKPDKYDIIGSIVILSGVSIMMYSPRQ
ncbi:YnfA family protein [Helicobacter sp. 13S00477-4]|uniref:YnfA family protein n=1 Tax=Helicobacter sp. 13S00477-4 TaxID=1905759 RepID=UPI000BA5211C|nr:YnfA family protein [Helicobacter sp. 13S00477-4]PAF52279.1 hypothetical protein BKH44_02935 [Helicobacter sp. 13S00477-4]